MAAVVAVMMGVFVCSAIAGPILPKDPPVWQSEKYTMDQLLLGEEIPVRDKVFSNFSWEVAADPNVTVPAPSAINVWGVIVEIGDRTEYGLRVQGGFSAGTGEVADFLFGFDVAILPNFPELYIVDNTLAMTQAGAAGSAEVQITETVVDVNGALVIDRPKHVYITKDLYKPVDHKQLEGQYKWLHVEKDILVSGISPNDPDPDPSVAHLSEFYNTFSQIPEPATMSLLGLGGLALLRRRRR
jgi:hypothetical protein